ncbi:hypothetical protein SAMN02745126_05043 [Enhydrobacter aerosaccus]|uniref:Uncharacterized protein n=1 Tax=Enhydrobacter aerosaccus TaxID=225324 RepID=A0A1T4SSM2_9HYPH|nr:hypothetical protein [Enhydrobacter aerosaccus]SKA30881.1 hypothetical protein SAMN02745126_05043 [Enhydrobacter aerosaccus]
MISLRRPAPADFLERRRARVDWARWGLVEPPPGSPRWLVETCRAELEWVEADWRRLGGDPFRLQPHQPHPAEALRLPHEQAAARLLNCHLHLDGAHRQIDDAIRRLRLQRRAAIDRHQSSAYRQGWRRIALDTEKDLRLSRRRWAQAWRAFLAAGALYERLRAAIEAPRAAAPSLSASLDRDRRVA